MYHFDVSIHAKPSGASAGSPIELLGRSITPLEVHPSSLSQPMPVSFEQAADWLAKLPRMFVEPDGSFVWVSTDKNGPWQVDGNLYDREDKLLIVELKGHCPRQQFDQLLAAFGWPEAELVIQFMKQAVVVAEDEFRRIASA